MALRPIPASWAFVCIIFSIQIWIMFLCWSHHGQSDVEKKHMLFVVAPSRTNLSSWREKLFTGVPGTSENYILLRIYRNQHFDDIRHARIPAHDVFEKWISECSVGSQRGRKLSRRAAKRNERAAHFKTTKSSPENTRKRRNLSHLAAVRSTKTSQRPTALNGQKSATTGHPPNPTGLPQNGGSSASQWRSRDTMPHNDSTWISFSSEFSRPRL